MEIAPGVEVDGGKCSGKPIVKGTRVPVALVLGQLAGGMSFQEVMLEYDLTRKQILACLAYAARTLEAEEVRATR